MLISSISNASFTARQVFKVESHKREDFKESLRVQYREGNRYEGDAEIIDIPMKNSILLLTDKDAVNYGLQVSAIRKTWSNETQYHQKILNLIDTYMETAEKTDLTEK